MRVVRAGTLHFDGETSVLEFKGWVLQGEGESFTDATTAQLAGRVAVLEYVAATLRPVPADPWLAASAEKWTALVIDQAKRDTAPKRPWWRVW